MRTLARIALACGWLGTAAAAGAQQHWREYPSIEGRWARNDSETPPDPEHPAEFVIGRLMFPQTQRRWMLGAGGGDWHRGGTAWTVDYPDADRTIARILARLSTLDRKSTRLNSSH